jgi:polysaccharide biosynthesis transport protein
VTDSRLLTDGSERGLQPRHAGTDLQRPYGGPDWYGYGGPNEANEERLDPIKIFWLVLRYRWLILALLAVGAAVGLGVTLMQAPKYLASARIEIMVPTARILEDMDVVAQSNDVRTFETARVKLKSRDLARRVVLELNLANDVDFLFPQPDFAISNILARVLGTPTKPSLDDYELEQRETIAIGQLLNGLSADLVRGTSLLEVKFSSDKPEMASRVANQVVRSYMDQQVDQTVATSDLARQFIDEQVADTKARLEASEAALVAYAKDEQLGAAGDGGALITANIAAINDALSKSVQGQIESQRLVAQIEAGKAGELPQVLESKSIQDTRAKLSELEGDYRLKSATFKPDFPEMRQLAGQIDEYKRQYQDAVDQITQSIRLTYEAANIEQQSLRDKLKELEAQQVAFRDKNIKYTILNREVESNRAQYDSLIKKKNDLSVVSDVRRANIDVVDFAVTPTSPYEPSLMRNLLLFLGASGALSAAAIYILELMNNKFSVPDQIESELKLPVLGVIPHLEDDKLQEAMADPRSALSEAFRSLRTSLEFSGTEGAPHTLLVTSSEPGESKSTTVFKLAKEFAAVGNKVLVIDGDLRRPSMHRMFRADNTIGLSNLLTKTIDQNEAPKLFHQISVEPPITLLSSGPMVPNPADLLASVRMSEVLRVCIDRYDVILVDGPPIIGLSDALILSRLCEATMLVVAAHQTTRKSARAALKRLRTAGGNIIGSTLNKVDVERHDYDRSFRYMYEGYYGYGANPAPEQIEGAPADARRLE